MKRSPAPKRKAPLKRKRSKPRAEMRQWLDDAIAETREDFAKRK